VTPGLFFRLLVLAGLTDYLLPRRGRHKPARAYPNRGRWESDTTMVPVVHARRFIRPRGYRGRHV
jgi:hypothetical protein